MDDNQGDLQAARRALITSAAGYAGMLAVAVAFHLIVSRRDLVTRYTTRFRAMIRGPVATLDPDVMAAMSADIDEITHADLSREAGGGEP